MEGEGEEMKGVVEGGRFAGMVVALRKDKAAGYTSAADLKGMKIGVSAPGSSTNFFVMYLMSKAGLKPTDAAYIGVGIGPSAVAAIKKGEIDALSNLDPMITKLEQDGDIKVVADSRTEEGTRAIFGGSNPAAVLYVRQDFIDKNPATVQALVNAFYKTLRWLDKATPEEIAATVPEDYFLGDKALYLAAVRANKPVYSRTGVIPAAGMKSAADMLLAFADRRHAGRFALLVAIHLAAFGIWLWSEDEPSAQAAFVLTWAALNFFWLVVLRRPLTSAALSLVLIVILIALSQFKHGTLLMTATFVDVMLIDAATFSFFLKVNPGLVEKLGLAVALALPVMVLLWRAEPFFPRPRTPLPRFLLFPGAPAPPSVAGPTARRGGLLPP